jgi:gamma-glutamylcyclotransferase (GGCT)/AIG2-like uncharacterized protein YtfP
MHPVMMGPETRLAVYGTLAPGKPNHHHLAMLEGTWRRGTVRGRLVRQGWGSALGFPALMLDADGPEVEVELFDAADLPAHWARLDAFEGVDYRREEVTVWLPGGRVQAFIYTLAPVAAS